MEEVLRKGWEGAKEHMWCEGKKEKPRHRCRWEEEENQLKQLLFEDLIWYLILHVLIKNTQELLQAKWLSISYVDWTNSLIFLYLSLFPTLKLRKSHCSPEETLSEFLDKCMWKLHVKNRNVLRDCSCRPGKENNLGMAWRHQLLNSPKTKVKRHK